MCSGYERCIIAAMIEVDNVSKRFGSVLAVDRASFQVARGEVVGFLGPNGAGKSTMMRILACFFPPMSGKVWVGGYDVISHSLEVRRMLGYFPEKTAVYPDLSVWAFLRFAAEAKDVPRGRRTKEVERVIENCGLQDVQNRIIGHLSKGFRQRVGIAQALIHEPAVLIFRRAHDRFGPRASRRDPSFDPGTGRRANRYLIHSYFA